MKKLFLTLALVVTSVAAMADRWTAPTSQTYPDETPLYVQVNIDDQADTFVPTITEIAAFIDGECRAQATQTFEQTGFYRLRVRGGEADNGKKITIKALYNGLVYTLSESETYDGEAQTHQVPLQLWLQPLKGIRMAEDQITLDLNQTYNLAENMQYAYGTDGMPTSASPIDETETPLTVTYKWDPKSVEGYITVSEAGIVTPVAVTGDALPNAMITVEGPKDDTGYQPYFEARVAVEVVLPPVTEIVVSPTQLTVYVGDNLYDYIRNGKLNISMLPANADQNYRWGTTAPSLPWNANYIFETAGDFTAQVYSTSNNDLQPVTVTFHVVEPLRLEVEASNNAKIGMIQPMTFKVYLNTLEEFDPSLLTVDQVENLYAASSIDYTVGAAVENENQETGLKYYVPVTITGRYVGTIQYQVTYNGQPIGKALSAVVCPEIQINSGWQWVSPYAFESGSEVGDICPNGKYVAWIDDLIEMRTQEGLLYVDANLGAFGDITQFSFTEGMYKVKSKTANVLRLASNDRGWELARNNDGTMLQKGYNWVVYPYEFPLKIEEVQRYLNGFAQEGDQIIAKDAFVEFSDGEWVGEKGFTFQPGEGYIYLYQGEGEGQFAPRFDINEMVPMCYQENQGGQPSPIRRRAKAAKNGWSIDASRFADNMTIVAALDLPEDERYLIGAFVGDECRGTGSMVRDGIAFINVAGKSGEQVAFRLVDTQTGETFDINETVKYAKKAGSMKAPLSLTGDGVTGISSVNTGANADNKAVYDLNGRRVAKPVKGVYVVGGRKVVF